MQYRSSHRFEIPCSCHDNTENLPASSCGDLTLAYGINKSTRQMVKGFFSDSGWPNKLYRVFNGVTGRKNVSQSNWFVAAPRRYGDNIKQGIGEFWLWDTLLVTLRVCDYFRMFSEHEGKNAFSESFSRNVRFRCYDC